MKVAERYFIQREKDLGLHKIWLKPTTDMAKIGTSGVGSRMKINHLMVCAFVITLFFISF